MAALRPARDMAQALGVMAHTPGIVIGGTDQSSLAAAATAAADRLAAPPHHSPDTTAAVRGTLEAALAALPPPHRTTTPLLVLADAYSTWAARRFAQRIDDPARRLRPSDSIRLETSELIRTVAVDTGWRGPCYQLAALTAERALSVASALISQHPSLLLCEVALLNPDDLTEPGCLAVIAVWPRPSGVAWTTPVTSHPVAVPSQLLAALPTRPSGAPSSRGWTDAA